MKDQYKYLNEICLKSRKEEFNGENTWLRMIEEASRIKRVLLVDDEDNIRLLVKFNLEKAGYEVVEASDGNIALKLAANAAVDIIILDLMLPETDGLEVCRRLKREASTAHIPIIMLTAKSDEIDRVIGLELGADDYLTKPFSQRELVARVNAVLRRAQVKREDDEELSYGPLRMNVTCHEVHVDGQILELTPKEYELLRFLLENIGKVFSREQLLEKIWGYEYYGDTRTVDVHVRHLRAKLEPSPVLAEAIETIRGVGYRLTTKLTKN